MDIGSSVHAVATHRGPWIVGAVMTVGADDAVGVDLVWQPVGRVLPPEWDVMDVTDLAARQLWSAPFTPGQVTEIRGEVVRLVPLSWWWRRKVRFFLGIRPERMLRVVPA